MAYGGAPSSSASDALRLLIGDTGATSVLADAEVAYFLSLDSNIHIAAAKACRAIAAEYAGAIDYSLGDLSESNSQKYAHWVALAKELEAAVRRGASGFSSTTPTVGTVYDSGTQPNTYAVSDEKPADWSLNVDDQPSTVRGIDQ